MNVYFPGLHLWVRIPLECACGKKYMTWEGLRACEWRHSREDVRHA